MSPTWGFFRPAATSIWQYVRMLLKIRDLWIAGIFENGSVLFQKLGAIVGFTKWTDISRGKVALPNPRQFTTGY